MPPQREACAPGGGEPSRRRSCDRLRLPEFTCSQRSASLLIVVPVHEELQASPRNLLSDVGETERNWIPFIQPARLSGEGDVILCL